MIKWFKERLVPEARYWYRFVSNWLNAAGVALLTWVQFDHVGVLMVWNMMPRPFRVLVPDALFTVLAIMLFVLAMIARLVRQPKLERMVERRK